MNRKGVFYILVTVICCLRAFQLFLSATKELRSEVQWFPLSSKPKPSAFDHAQKNDSTILGTESDNVFYFVHATDLHLSRFRPKGHTFHFLHFIQSILPVVRPEFVVVTGDLTDAKDKKRVTSQQYHDEWQIYQQAISEKVTVDWYDMRGNHDCFDLPSWQSRVNYYRTHGQKAERVEKGQGIYAWQFYQPSSAYQFVAIDACPKKGPSRPLNFFGYLTSKTMDQLEKALVSTSFNHTFVFSHYPTTTMVFGTSKNGRTFRDLASHYSVYFCGHLHKLIAGLGDVLKSYDPVTRSLELELGDLKEHGLYRIVAVDHDLISFVDIQLPLDQIPKVGPVNELGLVQPITKDMKIIWPEQVQPAPSILVTNPKDARFSIPSKEPLHRIRHSSHIRFLVFSQGDYSKLKVELFIDDKPHLFAASFVGDTKTPLWTAPWNATFYEDKRAHQLRVQVTQPNGQTGVSKTIFRVDSQRIKIGGGTGEFIIKSKMATLLQCITLLTMSSILLFLILPQCIGIHDVQYTAHIQRLLLRIHWIDQQKTTSVYLRLQKQILAWSIRYMQLPKDQPVVWHTTFVYILCLLTMPWFRANFIPSADTQQERYGIFYMWGMVFQDEWIPIADTWMLAAEQVVLDVFVFFMLVTWRSTDSVDFTCQGQISKQIGRQLNEKPWFKGLEAVYWLWRSSELVALASFYGGIWPTLVQNINVYWMLFSGFTLAWGKNGMFSRKRKQHRYLKFVQGCVTCQQHYQYQRKEKQATEEITSNSAIQESVLQYDSSNANLNASLTQEEEQQLKTKKVAGIIRSDSSSSTSFDDLPLIKNRRKPLKL
ncbi:Transmembrane protein 62 [Choanephora cucurbitarum]|uniref:Transmembrane protein 62 n=1 Tax=Choanephora cucurbitarum TaxID=101091 RepID=A0A1C7N7Q3_9FUNG|nr:Transmembrane protein 62 [Choanephora cucurbitarum]